MSEMGRNSTIEGVLNKSLDPGPLKPLNQPANLKWPQRKNYYCPICYGYDLYYREIEKGVFDIWCKGCDKHWTKIKSA